MDEDLVEKSHKLTELIKQAMGEGPQIDEFAHYIAHERTEQAALVNLHTEQTNLLLAIVEALKAIERREPISPYIERAVKGSRSTLNAQLNYNALVYGEARLALEASRGRGLDG